MEKKEGSENYFHGLFLYLVLLAWYRWVGWGIKTLPKAMT